MEINKFPDSVYNFNSKRVSLLSNRLILNVLFWFFCSSSVTFWCDNVIDLIYRLYTSGGYLAYKCIELY